MMQCNSVGVIQELGNFGLFGTSLVQTKVSWNLLDGLGKKYLTEIQDSHMMNPNYSKLSLVITRNISKFSMLYNELAQSLIHVDMCVELTNSSIYLLWMLKIKFLFVDF